MEKDWKLKLRYGLLKTPFTHYTLIAKGVAKESIEEFSCPAGNAYMAMKVWAESEEQAFDVVQSIAEQIGFSITGKTELWKTDPVDPPEEEPYGYRINFSSFVDE